MDIAARLEAQQEKAGIQGRDTVPEMVIHRTAHRLAFRFRLYRKDLPGRPDLAFPRYRVVVLVHGCLWHCHESSRYAYMPGSRIEFWAEKFRQNVARDRCTEDALRSLGWWVLGIWEVRRETMRS